MRSRSPVRRGPHSSGLEHYYLLCYARTLAPMAGAWLADEDMSHGLVVPFAVAYLVWGRLHQIEGGGRESERLGPALSPPPPEHAAGGDSGAWLFVMRVSLLVSVAGVLVAQGGFGMLRALAFPSRPLRVHDSATHVSI